MVRKIVARVVDDLDGTELPAGQGETVRFALDGIDYEMDLSQANADRLRGDLEVWTGRARRVGGRARRSVAVASPPGSRRSAAASEAAPIRAWARENGYDVSDRGTIPAYIREAYETHR